LFPITTGLTHFNFSSNTKTYFDYFKHDGYYLCGCFPDHEFFINLASNLDENYAYIYNKLDLWKNLSGGIGNSIIEKLKSLKQHEPWLFVLHIMDLHNLFALPEDFRSNEFGENDYDKMLSFIDVWIGKFLKEINLKNTLVVISSDHGAYIPVTGKIPDEIPTIQKIMKKGKKIVPSLEPAGVKMLLLMRKASREIRMHKLKKELSEYELRSLNNRGKSELFEETIRVPLIFAGYGIKNHLIFDNLVRHVDIFPTISEIVNLQNNNYQKDGRSLVPLLNNDKMDELPAYIETGVSAGDFSEKINPQSVGKIIGLRTSRYKYLRSRENTAEPILFDLKNDPQELTNIAEENQQIVKGLEKKLTNLITAKKLEKPDDLTEDEQRKAEDLLKKLGYI